VAAIAAVGFLVATVGTGRVIESGRAIASRTGLFGTPSVAAASQPPPSQPVVESPPPPAAAPPAAEAAPASERFDEAQKRALLEADKARSLQQKAKMNAAPAHRSAGYKPDGKPVFHKGGNKYDPLNASL
jgi:hypothetical protein